MPGPELEVASDVRLVAIHQPNFLPWLGYLDKLARADVFILLDTVQFPKTGGTWMNRVRMMVSGAPTWITVPVVRGHGVREVAAVRINGQRPWRAKILRTVEQNYAVAPYFDEVMPTVVDMINMDTDFLADFNEASISALATSLDIDASKITRASRYDVAAASTDLLIGLTKAVSGTSYLAGGGAGEYQEDEKFAASGLGLAYQGFEHPVYPQAKAPGCHGLSVVDALMNCGFAGVRALLCQSADRAIRVTCE